jgi:hypothetical protein
MVAGRRHNAQTREAHATYHASPTAAAGGSEAAYARKRVEAYLDEETKYSGGVSPRHWPKGPWLSYGDLRTILAALSAAHSQGGENAHPDDKAVDGFAAAMKAKLAVKRTEGRGGWDHPDTPPALLAKMLVDHLAKGDPVDVANFAMMLFHREHGAEALKSVAQASILPF